MRKLTSVFCAVAVVAASTVASAADFTPLFPSGFVGSFDHHEKAPTPVAESKAIELYKCVKIEDPDHIAPCAEPLIIKVLDPCWKPDPCACACDQKPKCVYVKICVPKKKAPCCAPKPSCCAPKPACGCEKDRGPKITCKKNGAYTKYDYGKYRIEIRVKNGWVVVDYDD